MMYINKMGKKSWKAHNIERSRATYEKNLNFSFSTNIKNRIYALHKHKIK